MDLLIKGLGLPAKDDEPIYIEINPNGKIYQKGKCLHYWGELPNKAIELPPHGRLIDADVLQAELEKHSYPSVREWYYAEVGQIIDECPTVLEAST